MSGKVDIGLLVANERSGTHLFRSLIASSKLVMAPGELCNAGGGLESADDFSFFSYRYNATLDNNTFIYPNIESTRELLDGYFSMLHNRGKQAGNRLFLCDIKYSHVHNFNSYWWDWLSTPFLFQYARERDIPIIHLVRHNVYETALSEIYARETGVWRASSSDELVTKTIRVNVNLLKANAERLREVMKLADGWLRGSRFIEVAYSDIAGPNADGAMIKVMKFLGLEGEVSFKSGFLKTTPAYHTVVENYDEIRGYFE